jgi:hypothetical protein
LASSISISLLPGLRDLIIMMAPCWWLSIRTRTAGLMTIPEIGGRSVRFGPIAATAGAYSSCREARADNAIQTAAGSSTAS